MSGESIRYIAISEKCQACIVEKCQTKHEFVKVCGRSIVHIFCSVRFQPNVLGECAFEPASWPAAPAQPASQLSPARQPRQPSPPQPASQTITQLSKPSSTSQPKPEARSHSKSRGKVWTSQPSPARQPRQPAQQGQPSHSQLIRNPTWLARPSQPASQQD